MALSRRTLLLSSAAAGVAGAATTWPLSAAAVNGVLIQRLCGGPESPGGPVRPPDRRLWTAIEAAVNGTDPYGGNGQWSFVRNAAAIKAFVVNRVGDFGFSLGIFLTFVLTGSVAFDAIFDKGRGRHLEGYSGFEATELETLLRELAPQVLGALTRRYGQFDAAEDAVQEALLAAALQWPGEGVPDNPRSWLIAVAGRRLVDEFAIGSETGRGTTVTMTKWVGER